MGGSLLAGLWPGELKPQARYLYAAGRADALLTAARDFGWCATPNLHLAFYTAAPQRRLYLESQVDVDEYTRRWEDEDDGWTRQYRAEEVRETLWPWLKRRGYATTADDRELEHFLGRSGSAQSIFARPFVSSVPGTPMPGARSVEPGSSPRQSATL